MDQVKLISVLGQGQRSVVYKARHFTKLSFFAVMEYPRDEKREVFRAVTWLHVLSQQPHPNIVKFHTWYETPTHLYVLVDYCAGSTFDNILAVDKNLPETSVRTFGRDILDGLHYVHSNGIIYGNLKPSNIILNEYGTLKLFDFFSASRVGENKPQGFSPKDLPYMAPEILSENAVRTRASDIWSFGCLLYEMAAGTTPFSSNNNLLTYVQSVQSEPYPPLAQASPELSNLIAACLRKDPNARIGWDALLTHPFWTGCKPIAPAQMPHESLFIRPDASLSSVSEEPSRSGLLE